MRQKFVTHLMTLACFILFFAPILVKSGGGGGGGGGKGSVGGGKGPLPTPCPTLTNIDFTISSMFFMGYANYLPAPFNHTNSLGTTNPNDNTKYYCKITIEPMIDATCYNVVNYTYYWINSSPSLVIQRPSNVVCKLTIEYYDYCAVWDFDVARSRRYWKYSTTIGTTQTFTVANMSLVSKVFGC